MGSACWVSRLLRWSPRAFRHTQSGTGNGTGVASTEKGVFLGRSHVAFQRLSGMTFPLADRSNVETGEAGCAGKKLARAG